MMYITTPDVFQLGDTQTVLFPQWSNYIYVNTIQSQELSPASKVTAQSQNRLYELSCFFINHLDIEHITSFCLEVNLKHSLLVLQWLVTKFWWILLQTFVGSCYDKHPSSVTWNWSYMYMTPSPVSFTDEGKELFAVNETSFNVVL